MKKLMTLSKRTVTTTTVYEISSRIVMVVFQKDGIPVKYFICEKNNIVVMDYTVDIKKDTRTYRYFNDNIYKKLKTCHFTEIEQNKYLMSVNDVLAQHKLKEANILCFDYSCHLIYNINSDIPLSGVYLFNHCNGVPTNLEYDLDELETYLKTVPEILSVKQSEIPYYNQEISGQKELLLKVLFSQKKFNDLWNVVKKDKFPSCRIKDEIIHSWSVSDPLGLKPFRYSEEEINKNRNCE